MPYYSVPSATGLALLVPISVIALDIVRRLLTVWPVQAWGSMAKVWDVTYIMLDIVSTHSSQNNDPQNVA
ncbi:hypothetical protein PAXINDRAFT_20964 [Paxillus involutus ATCC 200175]|uniref:Uncharacterized protein n=1 Tax=Paxillus involutus ATCC 200175 TaxID=664439 RepID=A0A0C9TC75_PAXIN|nr:hypothetical protein PAXINDRAFT_20964 [Paxillus involutus ATCC 200175]